MMKKINIIFDTETMQLKEQESLRVETNYLRTAMLRWLNSLVCLKGGEIYICLFDVDFIMKLNIFILVY